MRRGDVHEVVERGVDAGLVFPHVEHHPQVVGALQPLAQGLVIDAGATPGVDQHRARRQGVDARRVEQVPGRMLALRHQRRMQADDLGPLEQRIERQEILAPFRLGAWRITQQAFDVEIVETLRQAAAHIADPDDADGLAGQMEAILLGQQQQAREHVVDHRVGIASRSIGEPDARLAQVIEIDVIGTDGAGADEAHAGTFQKRRIHAGDRAHDQQVLLAYRRRVDIAAGQAGDVAQLSEEFVRQGNVFIDQDAHDLLFSPLSKSGGRLQYAQGASWPVTAAPIQASGASLPVFDSRPAKDTSQARHEVVTHRHVSSPSSRRHQEFA